VDFHKVSVQNLHQEERGIAVLECWLVECPENIQKE